MNTTISSLLIVELNMNTVNIINEKVARINDESYFDNVNLFVPSQQGDKT